MVSSGRLLRWGEDNRNSYYIYAIESQLHEGQKAKKKKKKKRKRKDEEEVKEEQVKKQRRKLTRVLLCISRIFTN